MPHIRQSTTVARRIEDLAEILGARPADWLVAFARIAVYTAEAAGDRRAGLLRRGPAPDRSVVIDLSDAPAADDYERVDATIHWTTDGFRWAFTEFDGRLVARRESATSTVVTLEGAYRLPEGAAIPNASEAAKLTADTAVALLLRTIRDAVEEQSRSGA
ncbi:MAG: hypothetical protein E6G68_05230 [Actinobacteria bacterium]|nr:MAG: hypothetical protein E6G68_05230 [Actinomycetota bacterium]